MKLTTGLPSANRLGVTTCLRVPWTPIVLPYHSHCTRPNNVLNCCQASSSDHCVSRFAPCIKLYIPQSYYYYYFVYVCRSSVGHLSLYISCSRLSLIHRRTVIHIHRTLIVVQYFVVMYYSFEIKLDRKICVCHVCSAETKRFADHLASAHSCWTTKRKRLVLFIMRFVVKSG